MSEDHAELLEVIHEQVFVLVVHARVVGLVDSSRAILQELLYKGSLRLLGGQTGVEGVESCDDLTPA